MSEDEKKTEEAQNKVIGRALYTTKFIEIEPVEAN
jgi:hypothetical protein